MLAKHPAASWRIALDDGPRPLIHQGGHQRVNRLEEVEQDLEFDTACWRAWPWMGRGGAVSC